MSLTERGEVLKPPALRQSKEWDPSFLTPGVRPLETETGWHVYELQSLVVSWHRNQKSHLGFMAPVRKAFEFEYLAAWSNQIF